MKLSDFLVSDFLEFSLVLSPEVESCPRFSFRVGNV